MNWLYPLALLSLVAQWPDVSPGQPSESAEPLEKSAYFAFVDRDYIFTVEMVKPGIPILNFVSMTEDEISVSAKNVRLTLDNRKAAATVFAVEAGDFQQPMMVPSITMRPRSSFGLRLEGKFGDAKEIYGATIRLGNEDLKLAPLTDFGFEKLVLKVNRINLGSPDFREDWQVLRLELLGSRAPALKRNY
jgi:hypothetical protein